MLEELKDNYNCFHDSIITNINYGCIEDGYTEKRNLTIKLTSINILTDVLEIIKIHFYDIVSFKFKEENQSAFVVFKALLTKDNDLIIFDFSPDIYGDSILKENPNSEFIIKCRKVTYEVIT